MIASSKSTAGSRASTWDRVASSYDSTRKKDPVYISCIHLTARVVPKDTVICLDAGCGTGLSSEAVSSKCRIVIAVDYSRDSLKILRSKNLQNVILVQADLTALPFKESVFNACVCANAFQHLAPGSQHDIAASELKRVTKEKGILSVSVHHYSRSKQKAGWIKEGKPGQAGIDYIYRFNRDYFQSLFPDSIVKGIGYYGWLKVPFWGSRLQNVIGILFGKIAAFLGFGHMLISITPKIQKNRR
ncbi:MAG TPA: class I SAM-dependent methyltransferase [Caldithrix abyssi]|uniref:Class I SAM-dependent methyltransferase n=1 Tax=Caldithrix abyssi TaxID=187145 RepID=A0A7V4UDP0_CALAY|nr:class I SAM-dependent methyltransferase [Caldithrix abyssi]